DQPEAMADLEAARATLETLLPEHQAVQLDRGLTMQQRHEAERQADQAEQQLASLEQEMRALEASLAVEEARGGDRAERMRSVERQLQQSADEYSSTRGELEGAQTTLAEAARGRESAAEAERIAIEAVRETSQQADRLHGALAALGAEDLSGGASPRVPDEWRALVADLPVIGLAGELVTRVRPIDRLMRAYLLRVLVLANNRAAREAHRRLHARIAQAGAAWAVLSLDGLLLTPGGERPLAEADAGAALADWRREMHGLQTELAAAEARRAAALEALARARSALQAAEDAEREARDAVNTVSPRLEHLARTRRILESELHDLHLEHGRAQARIGERAAARAEANQKFEVLRARVVSAREQRELATRRANDLDERLSQLGEALKRAQAEVVLVEAAHKQRQTERNARASLRDRILAELASTRQALEGATNWRSSLDSQLAELVDRERQLGSDLEAARAELAPLAEDLAEAEQRRVESQAQRRVHETRLVELRAAERAAHERREQAHVDAQRCVDELARLHDEIAETAELESDLPGGAAAAWAEQLRLDIGAAPLEMPDLDAMRRRISLLQRELRAVGGVAESVVQEFREISERHDFLVHQSDDLRAAMVELQQAADELETHMRARFAHVFEAVQAAFQTCFQQLFGGGEARLVLTDPDDLLRSGIDIVARPPGKKLQGLLSLSGGERALTIVALLFGLLRVNPTPFCVLDEVDAALDEANVHRFANLLADFARSIQFIVVTHNRATMDRADALYGVSMDTHGVSRIFSIRPQAVAASLA
ncbi:MAG: hypothetical protein M3336_08600, partial [Chloroflexota bacterium]|nr:hypothetical protein [Chloroflexota bacterium]